MITRAQIEAAADELEYLNFRQAKEAGESATAIAAYFGVRRHALEARYEREHNAGARIADDGFCVGCGARGHAFTCPPCSRRERL